MKKHFKLIIALLLFFCIFVTSFRPVRAQAIRNAWDDYYNWLVDLNYRKTEYVQQRLKKQYKNVKNFLEIATKLFTGEALDHDGSHGGGGHSRDAADVLNTDPVSNPQPIYKNYDNSVYNPVTNNYETINYYYDDNSTENYVYSFETTNNYITYEYNYTYYDIVVSPKDSPTDGKFFKIYYELPDGRSSYNLTPNDIKGVIFNYDVINYVRTSTDSDVIGLWHLDGDFYNSVSDRETYITNQSNINFVDGRFGGAIGFEGGNFNTIQLDFMNADSVPSVWTLEFWVYVPQYYSTLWSPVDGSVHNYSSFPSLNTPGWSTIAIDSNGDMWVNGQYTGSVPNYMFSNDTTDALTNDVMIGLGGNSYFVDFSNTMNNYQVSSGNIPVYNFYYATYTLDEIKLTKRILYNGSYTPRYEPWDLNFAYTVPTLTRDYSTIAIQSPFDVNNFQIGGVRNSSPSVGDVFISLYDGVATSISQYFNGVWNTVNGAVYINGSWEDLLRYNFNTLMLVSDDDVNTGATYIYNYFGDGGTNYVDISGDDITFTIDTTDADPQSVLKLLSWIPLLFGAVGTILGVLCPFLPAWLTGLIGLCLGAVITLILFVFIRRK